MLREWLASDISLQVSVGDVLGGDVEVVGVSKPLEEMHEMLQVPGFVGCGRKRHEDFKLARCERRHAGVLADLLDDPNLLCSRPRGAQLLPYLAENASGGAGVEKLRAMPGCILVWMALLVMGDEYRGQAPVLECGR